jgi:hypothetical protein
METLSAPSSVSNQQLSLHAIHKIRIQHGGYNIRFSGHVPKEARVRLLIGSDADYVDITPHYHTAHLPALLDILDQKNYWAQLTPRFVDCTVAVFVHDVMVPGSQSGAQQLPCPVAPVEIDDIGNIAALGELGDVLPKLNYVKDGATHGRILSKPIHGRYYFVLGSILETDPGNRGFDCTTFVGSALGRHSGMGDDSPTFANSLGATQDVLTEKHLNEIRKFVTQYPVGAYLMWSGGHIVTLIDGTVQEFTTPNGHPGYRKTDIQTWHPHDHKPYTLREIPAEFL